MNALFGILLIIGLLMIISFVLKSIGKIFKYLFPIVAIIVAVVWIGNKFVGEDWFDKSKQTGKELIENRKEIYDNVKENISEENLRKGVKYIEVGLDSLQSELDKK